MGKRIQKGHAMNKRIAKKKSHVGTLLSTYNDINSKVRDQKRKLIEEIGDSLEKQSLKRVSQIHHIVSQLIINL